MAIVGVNQIVVKPVWRDGGFVPRKTMNLSSSFDHRVVDGHDAATFIQRVRALIEAPRPSSSRIEDCIPAKAGIQQRRLRLQNAWQTAPDPRFPGVATNLL